MNVYAWSSRMPFRHAVYISHHPDDRRWVEEELERRLEQADISYIDENNFTLGRPRMKERELAIVSSRKSVLVFSQAYLRNTWQNFEADLTMELNLQVGDWRVIPVLVQQVTLPLRFGALVGLELYNADEAAWTRLLQELNPQPGDIDADAVVPIGDGQDLRLLGQNVVSGLDVLLRARDREDVRNAIAEYQADFRTVCEQISKVGDLKEIHDLLYLIDTKCSRQAWSVEKDVPANAAEIPRGGLSYGLLNDAQQCLVKALEKMNKIRGRGNLGDEPLECYDELCLARDQLTVALATANRPLLSQSVFAIDKILFEHPARINAQLRESAADLRLPALWQAMRSIYDRLSQAEIGPAQIEVFGNAVLDLARIKGIHDGLLQEHDAWQKIDGDLRYFERFLDSQLFPRAIRGSWSLLLGKVEPVWTNVTQDWADRLRKEDARLRAAVDSGDLWTMKDAFQRFRTEASTQFDEVDQDFLNLCSQLREVGRTLSLILGFLA
jgi:hypothetical protein